MLGARVASAAVLIPIVIAVLWLSPLSTAIVTGLGGIIAANEFYRMAERSEFQFRPIHMPGYLAAAMFSLAGFQQNLLMMLFIILGLVALSLPFVLSGNQLSLVTDLGQPASGTPGAQPGLNLAATIFGAIYGGVPLGLVALVRATPPEDKAIWWILLMCLGTWGADTGGYFFGRWFGKHKLAPKISPKKTVEGAIGGILTAMLGVGLVGGLALNIPVYITLPLGLILAVGSIAGDLFESWMKRRFDVKDSGTLIPGHGGLLDRIDSFLVVVVLTYIFILIYRI